MIKLILNPDIQPITYTFYKPFIVIGCTAESPESQPDLILSIENLDPTHVTITEDNGIFFVINQANDPLTTLNGLSFRKAILKNGDLLKIGSITIEFQGEISDDTNEDQPPKESSRANSKEVEEKEFFDLADLEAILDQTLESTQSPIKEKKSFPAHPGIATQGSAKPASYNIPEEFDLEAEMRSLEILLETESSTSSEDDSSQEDISSLLKKVEELESLFLETQESFPETNIEESLPENKSKTSPGPKEMREPIKPPILSSYEPKAWEDKHPSTEKQPPERKSLKDLYISEFDDENENWNQSKDKKQPPAPSKFAINWKPIATGLLSLLVIFSVGLGAFYWSASGKSFEEEIHAAEAVADVTMALNFAQINHTLPQNQNWSDPEFLKNNLTAVLASEYQPLANVDSHGQFQNAPYILRIYTSSDLSHFLVIAQPSPSLFQWLIPKATIIVDSRYMELRKTNDLKILNRLLINTTLDNSNNAEISALVNQGELIPLKTLAQKQAGQGFTPPKALAFIRNGAENLIYNAPRYYHFGESLTRRVLSLYEHESDSQEVSILKEEVEAFTKYPNIVLYSAGGIQVAAQAQRALATFLPQYKFIFAYLQFDSSGLMTSTHLLMDDGSAEYVAFNKPLSLIDNDSDDEEESAASSGSEKQVETETIPQEKNLGSPLDNLLVKLYEERQNTLKPLADEITLLLNSENKAAIPDFSAKLHSLQELYASQTYVYQSKIIAAISLISLVTLNDASEDKPEKKAEVESEYKQLTPAQKPAITVNQAEPNTLREDSEIDKNHPLYFRLLALYNARQQTLKPISDEMIALLDVQNEHSQSNFSEKIDELERKYEKLASDLQKRIIKAVSHLHREYANMPLNNFMSYVRGAGLESIVQENIRSQGHVLGSASQISPELVQGQVEKIQQSKDLKELDSRLNETNKMLSLEKVPDASLLNSYQNTIHGEVTKKLDAFLLTSSKKLSPEELNDKNRVVLVRILRSGWVTDPDEIDYYLNEFDLLTQQHK